MKQECWIKLNDLKIRYFEAGKDNPNHILFIHGLGSAADRWLDIPEKLSESYHTIAIDLPGFGFSDKSDKLTYTIPEFRKIILNFMNKTKINDGKTTIVGHSLGGYIAAEIAIEEKQMVEKLVLIDSSGMLNSPTSILEQYLKAALNPTKESVRKTFEKMVTDPKRVPEKLVESFIERINLKNAKYAFESTLANSTSTQIGLLRLKTIKAPTLILWGEVDNVIPCEHSKIFHDSIKELKMITIRDSGHAPFAEKPIQVYEILKKFLN